MKKLIDIKRFAFYGWTGLAFVVLGILSGTHRMRYPETASGIVLNNAWMGLFLTLVNYVLFEYAWPRLGRKRIFKTLGWLTLYIFLYSWGMYAWRGMGIGLSIYTSFLDYSTVEANVADRMGYSMSSLLF